MSITGYIYGSTGNYSYSQEFNEIDDIYENATTVELPELTEDHTIQNFIKWTEDNWTGEGDYVDKDPLNDGYWIIIADYYGYIYWTPENGIEPTMSDYGVFPPEGAVEVIDGVEIIQDDNGIWRLKTDADYLIEAKVDQINVFKTAYNAVLNNDGFTSRTLGYECNYDGATHNVDWILGCTLASIVAAVSTSFRIDETFLITCDDMLGNEDSKISREHTHDECFRLFLDGMRAVNGIREKYEELEVLVNSATTIDDVNLILWDDSD